MDRLARLPALLLTLALFAAGCASADDPASAGAVDTTSRASTTTVAPTTTIAPATTTARAARPHPFTTAQMTFVDDTRPTPESPGGPEIPSRTLETWLYLPDTPEPAPLVIFSHGMAGHPRKFEDLHAAWAEAGYAVAAPVFPLSNDTAEGSFTNLHDVPNQAGDVAFVLDQLLALSADATTELAGRFDPHHLAAGGLSAGGATTFEAAVNDVGRDPRLVAAIIMAGARFTSADNESFVAPGGQPVYILHGDSDPLVSLEVAQESYDLLDAPKYFTTLIGGGHAGPFEDDGEGVEPKIPGTEQLIHTSTIAFLDRYVLGIAEAADELIAAAADSELATFVHDAG
ncbi:MAG: alpha/beta hydrolase [Acidimicrobiia bacterium]|nr:alpha/beta hydrolase [Acidimicrobiia bacterium]